MSKLAAKANKRSEESGFGVGRLTAKQERFVEEFLIDLNGTQAAIRAGYSEKTARSIAQENLTKPDIVSAIQEAKNKRSGRVKLTADDVLKRLWDIGSVSITDVIEWTNESWRVKESKDIPPSVLGAIQSITIRPDGVGLSISIRMHDKLRALDACGKHLGMFTGDSHEGDSWLLKTLNEAQAIMSARK